MNTTTRKHLRHLISRLRALKQRFHPIYSAIDKLILSFNRRWSRSYIPDPRRQLYIETSSVCNLKCRFCAYDKKSTAKSVMPLEKFQEIIAQALEMGYRVFGLTPITGDVFMDAGFMTKLDWLEQHPKVEGYTFYTNFTLPTEEKIQALCTSRKLRHLTISVYGHDEESFVRITKGTAKSYDRLVLNLRALNTYLPRTKATIEIGWRTYSSFVEGKNESSELVQAVAKLRKNHGVPVNINRFYDNWGGYITQSDLADLDMKLLQEEEVHKAGACALIFHKNQIMADGRVNACACRDVDATLVLGDTAQQSLRDILSNRNEVYMSLIARQERGDFHAICRSCTFYRSIYKPQIQIATYESGQSVDLATFYKRIE